MVNYAVYISFKSTDDNYCLVDLNQLTYVQTEKKTSLIKV